MNENSKKKREKRVREKKLKQREAKIKENKEKNVREKLQHLTRQRQVPIVNSDEDILQRNIEVLENAIAEHEAMLKFREDNKEQIEEAFQKAKEKSKQDFESIFETTTAGFAPAKDEIYGRKD